MLPVLQTPTYETKLFTVPKPVKFRPFLVKEQKVLLTALQTDNRKAALRAMVDCAKVCTFNELDVESLPSFDVEKLFMHIRAKSVGEILPTQVKCDKCGEYTPHDIHIIDDMKFDRIDNLTNLLMLNDEYGMDFSFPTINIMSEMTEVETNTISFYIHLAVKCLKGVVMGEDYFTAKDSTDSEKMAVFESLTSDQYTKLQDFFDNLPQLTYEVKFKCGKCGHDNEIVLEGSDSFFG